MTKTAPKSSVKAIADSRSTSKAGSKEAKSKKVIVAGAKPLAVVADKVWNASAYAKAPRREYPVPAGRRLQLSGQWLSDAGFAAGGTYGVRKMKNGLRVVAGEGGAAITASHGNAKVYVAAELLPENGQVEVLAVAKGKLFIRPKSAK